MLNSLLRSSTARLALFATLLGATTLGLRADFSGAYGVGAAGSYNLVSGQSTAFGEWDGLLITSGATGGSGSISTTSTPNSLTLSVTGNIEGGVGTLSFVYDSFATAGTVSFDFSGNAPVVLLDATPQSATGSSFSFQVLPGQDLTVRISATGTVSYTMMMPGGINPITMMPEMIPMFMPGFATSQTTTLSNFSGPVSAIPEPSSCAALAGASLLGFAVLRRRRVA